MGGTIIHTQVQFSHRRPLKDMQNMLYWYDLSRIFAIRLLACIVIEYWYLLTGKRVDHFVIIKNLYTIWTSPVLLLPDTLSGYVTVTVTGYVTDYRSRITG